MFNTFYLKKVFVTITKTACCRYLYILKTFFINNHLRKLNEILKKVTEKEFINLTSCF